MTVAQDSTRFSCFLGPLRLAEGSLLEIALAAKEAVEEKASQPLLAFNRSTGSVVDLNLSGTRAEVRARYTAADPEPAKRGRPKLGVQAREVTLLPRHWEWLALQPGGASVTLRRLVDDARRNLSTEHSQRARINATYKFAHAIAGDSPNFEEFSRALFAGNFEAMESLMRHWAADIRSEIRLLLRAAEDAAISQT